MATDSWNEHVADLRDLLMSLSLRDLEGAEIDAQDGFKRWCELTLALRDNKRTIYLVGNGASASMASHMAADLAKNAKLHTQVFSDLSLITAISNDMGYEHVFAEPLSRRAQAGDMLVAISSSGRSPNVVAAVSVARHLGLTIVTLSGMDENNPLRSMGDLNLYLPAKSYGYAESCHATILHHWMDGVEVNAKRSVVNDTG